MVFGRQLAVSPPSLPADWGGSGRRRSRREPDSGPQGAGGPNPASERPLRLAGARLPIAVGPSSLGCADRRRPQHPRVQAGLAAEDGAKSAEKRESWARTEASSPPESDLGDPWRPCAEQLPGKRRQESQGAGRPARRRRPAAVGKHRRAAPFGASSGHY